MRPVFVGNIGYDARQGELERLFSKYGTVDRVDIKSGYAFVYFEDERDAEDAVRCLDNYPFGYDRRKLSVEWARTQSHNKSLQLGPPLPEISALQWGERGRARDAPKGATLRPTKSLFVINFDPVRTRVRDIERHFDPYGKVLNVRVRRNFAFVQFETVEEATKALECTNMSKLLDRVISVEYALRDDNDERGYRDGSLGRGGYGRSPYRRSPSPLYRHSRPSPDYGRGSRGRPSPDYGRPRSPVYDRYDGPAPAYDRRHSPVYDRLRSPVYDRIRSRSSPMRR